MTPDPLALEGWLWLARPMVAALVLLFAVAAWMLDRAESRRRVASARKQGAWAIEVVDPGPAALEKGAKIPLAGRITLGRSPDCSIVIEDPSVSALHALLRVDDGRCVLEDMGSRNGTMLDGDRVERPSALVEGSEIRVGDVRLVARCGP